MVEFPLGYREVVPDQTLPDKWKEITLNTGGSQSTLQDIKVPERAGGYSYKDSSKYFTRNRFIYWRICHDILELVEHSLDINLANCRVRYKFTDTPILDGISIHETINSVIILIVTVSSVHKLTFSHPDKIHKQENLLSTYTDLSVQSIFSEASAQNARDPHTFHIISNAGTTNSPVPHAAASWLTLPQEEALFALAYSSATILLLRLDTLTGLVHTSELKQDSIVPKFLSGIATAFRGRNTEAHVAMSLVIHSIGSDTYLFALCRGGNVRIWSCNKTQCVSVMDAAVENRIVSQGAQGHVLRKALGSDNELYLGTFLKFSGGCEFSFLKPVQDNGIFKFVRLCTLYAPDQHLVDFAFTPTRLWAVWRTADMDAVAVTHAQLSLNGMQRINSEWETTILEQARDRDYIVTDPGTDPRQAYINYIFHPGQFSLVDITKALSIYRRSNVIAEMTFSPAVLKERVCMAVEAEIQAEVMDSADIQADVIMDEDYLEIANRCWSKFYSCVVQYHANGTRPVGLLLLPSVYGIVLLKKSSLSLLRPMEALEHLVFCNDKSYTSRFKTTPVLSQDEDTCQDLITLMSALVILGEQLSEEAKTEIERELYHLRSPDIIIDNLLSKVMLEPDDPLSDFDFQSELYHKLSSIKDVSRAMAMLLDALTYDLGQPNKLQFENDHDASRILLNVNHLFGSQLGISAVAETITQIALLRFSICRDLLILQQFILLRPEIFHSSSLHTVKSSLAPRTVVLTQAYYVVTWICESTATYTPSQSLLESSSQRLSMLKLVDPRINVGQRQHRSLSLLELFIHSSGGKHAHILMAQANMDPTTLIPWHYSMLTHVTLIAQLVWPISGNFIFPEWLLSSCQFLLVQEYVRLLNTWCEWNSASRKFILAVALLEMGEVQKACDNFLRASNGILTDVFLVDALLNSNVTSRNRDLVHYYLKVIKLFEEHNASDCIIEIAETAIATADADDPNLPTLHSIVFAQHLGLGHHAEAYHYLNANPDAARRVDCLRQLVVTLFEKKLLIDLISFPYVDMYEDLERIVEGRARSVDLMENNYYNFLYSFHVNKQNMRKAASVMYEQAMRLSQEPHSAPIIAKQAQCLLACINALHHVSEKYRWIVRPVDQNLSGELNSSAQKKRNIDGKEILHYKIKKQVEVLELEDIKKEYYIVDARLKISKASSDMHIVAHTEPSELIITLCSTGLYTTALHLCDEFKISKASVLESLTSQCIKLSQREDPNAWDWLIQNDIFDIGISNTTIANTAWRLLEYFVLKHEKDDNSELHKAVARKLLQDGAFLPQWLLISYKKRNASELLRLMLNTGRLVEASELAVDYINAALGSGKEHFGFETPLVATAPSTWLPLNTIEVLLNELEYLSKDSTYIESYDRLNSTLEKYLETAERVSEDMIKMRTMREHS
ncbi:Nuclear pore complex protein Nup160-like protein [Camponotus floridanus]|uniref:Nuclear pore complex protein Nup160-like protein n=1 Tax=Camponotus floridanus TaxID=104421 RepID=E1ZVT2_CAMFO|nr:nuclear pore complex protein Nup160 homolog [Camponotus floridanus]XP_019882192.1 nuclear pore complex protein Nup160 homolog [Camponotus floridanus]EFN74716.1 Nuclear pore complex protein Nup160-like protein [Camponotus floridanus]